MPPAAARILRTYVTLTLFSTFAASLIWGINTLFLLDGGLSVTAAFAANAFFTAGQVLFEVPTGVVADTAGRRTSYLLGSATLFLSTALYLLMWWTHGPFWAWALVSMLLGLGFTFFSGATEAWLVDGLKAAGYEGTLEDAMAKGQIASGIAMLTGTVAGGVIAQFSSLGVPYALRAGMLAITFGVAFVSMHDDGFTPRPRTKVWTEIRATLRSSLDHGIKSPPVRWLMVAGPFSAGVGMYGFYAIQPHLLDLWGRGESYAIAGLAAAIVASAQIGGGLLVPHTRRIFQRRTSALIVCTLLASAALAVIGLASSFWLVVGVLAVWAIVFAVSTPIRQSYLNGLIPSSERATVLSSDNLLASTGGVFFQPALGRIADVWSYPVSYLVSAGIQVLAIPFLWLARRERAPSDPMTADAPNS